MLPCILQKLTMQRALTDRECAYVVEHILQGQVSDVQVGALLAALATKGITRQELAGFAKALRDSGESVACGVPLLDITGMGGDRTGTFNISTTAAFVIAAGGISVAKHGTRARSSRSGSADVLEALGVNLFLSPESCLDMIGQIGICYFYTRYYYYRLKQIDVVQKQLGIDTVFDMLRPLQNPATIHYQLIGVNHRELVTPIAHTLAALGVPHGMVVYGHDGSDEISAAAKTTIGEIHHGDYREYEICPEQFSLPRCDLKALRGGTAKENAAITRRVLQGEKGAYRTAILLNAGAGLYLGGAALTWDAAIKEAGRLIDSGLAMEKLEKCIIMSQNLKKVEKIKLCIYQDEEDML